MTFPEWTKPSAYGALAGAIAITIVGFTWGGWTTAGSAQEMAQAQSTEDVAMAMVPVCLNASEVDPDRVAKLATLRDSSTFRRNGAMMATGWATFPGTEEPSRALATACAERLNLDGS